MARYLVIGGGSGIGEALSKHLIDKNHDVSILCRNNPSIPKTTYLSCDVTKDSFPELKNSLNGLAYCPGSINLKPLRKLVGCWCRSRLIYIERILIRKGVK